MQEKMQNHFNERQIEAEAVNAKINSELDCLMRDTKATREHL
jgi:hypothetical protein